MAAPPPPLTLAQSPTFLLATLAAAAAAVPLTVFVWRRLTEARRRRTEILCGGATSRALVELCPSLHAYAAPWFLLGGGLITLYTARYRARPHRLRFAREFLVHEGGGHNALDWLGAAAAAALAADAATPGAAAAAAARAAPLQFPISAGAHAPTPVAALPLPTGSTLIIVHGLVGGWSERYVQHMAQAWVAASPHRSAVVFNARGCGGTTLSSPQSFNGSHTSDLRAAVASLRLRVGPGVLLFAVGYSLGASLVTKFLCEEGTGCELTAAAACCTAFDLVESSAQLEKPLARRTWNALLATSLRRYLRKHRHIFDGLATPPPFPRIDAAAACAPTAPSPAHCRPPDLDAALRGTPTLRSFDGATVAPMFGYSSAEGYYKDASTAHRHHEIGRPFLTLAALDDPICSATTIPRSAILASPFVVAAISKEGGHVSWPLGEEEGGRTWDNFCICEFFAAVETLVEGKAAWTAGLRAANGAAALPATNSLRARRQ